MSVYDLDGTPALLTGAGLPWLEGAAAMVGAGAVRRETAGQTLSVCEGNGGGQGNVTGDNVDGVGVAGGESADAGRSQRFWGGEGRDGEEGEEEDTDER